MKSSDKFLIGIVAGIVVLIVVALAVTLSLPETAYQSADSPEGVAHNYLLALQKGEYERAWSCLSPTLRGYPRSAADFAGNIRARSWNFRLDRDSSLSIESADISGLNATVTVSEVWLQGGDLFDSSQASRIFEMDLILVEGEWKIIGSAAYWADCWNVRGGCN
jgi:hypothetical protein